MNQKKFKLNLDIQKPDLREILRGNEAELQEINRSLILLGRAIVRWKQINYEKQNN